MFFPLFQISEQSLFRETPHLCDHTYSVLASPKTMKRKLQSEIEVLRKRLKVAHKKLKRQTTKIRSLLDLIKVLKQNGMPEQGLQRIQESFSGEAFQILQSHVQNMGKESNGNRFTKELLQIAQTIHYFSPRAYEYLRDIFTLPTVETIRKSLLNIKCQPGFTHEAFQALQAIHEKQNGDVYYCLTLDSMCIRNLVQWDAATQRLIGQVDIGTGDLNIENDKPASEALVFMLNALNSRIKTTVGYFLIKSITGSTLANLVTECLWKCHDIGAKVVCITCDGAGNNQAMAIHLGASLHPAALRGTFLHPADNSVIYYMPDAVHMIKLLRNALGDMKTLVYDDCKKVCNIQYDK